MVQRIVASGLALALVGLTPVAGQQARDGAILGHATDEARKPYSDYTVQLRDADSGQVVGTSPLDARGNYSFENLDTSRSFLVELFDLRKKQILCTEGPHQMNREGQRRRQVNIDCGAAPAALWLLAASAGTVAAVAMATESKSE